VWQAFVSIPATQVKGKGRDGQPEIGPPPVLFFGIRPASDFAEVDEFFHRSLPWFPRRACLQGKLREQGGLSACGKLRLCLRGKLKPYL